MNSYRPAPLEQIEVKGVLFTHSDIFKVVDDFYHRIQNDPVLQVPFQSVHDWPEHIDRITHFWWIRMGGSPYAFAQYNPVAKHYFAGFNQELLKRWLNLFHETLKDHLSPKHVELWLAVAEAIGRGLTIKDQMFRESQGK